MKAFFLESKKVDVSVDQASLLLFLSLKAFVSLFPVTLPPRQVSTLLNWRLFILPHLLHFLCLGIMVSSGLSPFTDLSLPLLYRAKLYSQYWAHHKAIHWDREKSYYVYVAAAASWSRTNTVVVLLECLSNSPLVPSGTHNKVTHWHGFVSGALDLKGRPTAAINKYRSWSRHFKHLFKVTLWILKT